MKTKNMELKAGDTVLWAGAWGEEPYKPAVVTEIQINCNGTKYGENVEKGIWDEVQKDGIVSLDNGHWAYGRQIKPLTKERRGRQYIEEVAE